MRSLQSLTGATGNESDARALMFKDYHTVGTILYICTFRSSCHSVKTDSTGDLVDYQAP